MKTDHQKRVESFMEKAGQAVPKRPQIPASEIRELRASLILEEAIETINALGFDVEFRGNEIILVENRSPQLNKIADGCGDLSVVTIGTLSACGIPDDLILREIDFSNLKKFDSPKCPKCSRWMFQNTLTEEYNCQICNEILPKTAGPHKRIDGKLLTPANRRSE